MGHAYSILVVEDERIVAKDLQETLNGLGYDAFAIADSADEAIEVARKRRPDVVLLDIRIKGTTDGIDTAGALRERFGVPVIFLTAHADDATIERAKKTEPQAYLLKPVRPAELKSAIEVSRYRVAAEERAREAEAALRASEARYRLIVETAREGICITNVEGRITFANHRLEEMLGYGAGALVGEHFTAAMDDESAERARVAFSKRIPGEGESGEWKLRNKGGRDVWVRSHATPIEFDGEFIGVLAMMTDVTEEKEAERERERLQAQMIVSDRLASVGLLAAGVGHEINNPLTFIMWNLEMLSRALPRLSEGAAGASVAELTSMIDVAREGADRVRRIVSGLKTFARAEEGRNASIDISSILDSSIAMAANEIRHRARLEREYRAVPMVEADEARLGQVFLNLLVNAAHAIPEGHADTNEVRVSTGTDGEGRAVVEIRDTGSGIPDEVANHVFDPFFTTKAVGAGTGLGLAVCHAIVTSLGGHISFESRVGQGSVFRVALPPASRLATTPSKQPPPISTRRRGRVLVVDDDQRVANTLRYILDAHDVVIATNGREALEILDTGSSFDVILCDLMMPVMTGMDLFAALEARRSEHTERMVFITGGAFTSASRRFLDGIANRVLEKPFDSATIRAVVQEYVR